MGWLVGIAAFVGVSVVIGLLSPPKPGRRGEPEGPITGEGEAHWTPDAVARLGMPETVVDLVAQGRADELRGLGYRGDLPQS